MAPNMPLPSSSPKASMDSHSHDDMSMNVNMNVDMNILPKSKRIPYTDSGVETDSTDTTRSTTTTSSFQNELQDSDQELLASDRELLAYVIEAKRVISLEAEALQELSDSVDLDFGKAVALMQQCMGRIIVTGVGKSGLIGAKIAATFSSTGSPSQFVHACDAAHGDLGMITPDDVVLGISKSGASKELQPVLDYCHTFHVPVVAITQKPCSTLGLGAKYVLLIPNVKEACSLGMAPTTSSTATLAIGDALAAALVKARGFSKRDFGVFHPGGSLGRLLLPVGQLLHTGMPLCQMSTTVGEALLCMTSKRLGCVGVVVEEDGLVGVITQANLRLHMTADLLTLSASEIMTSNPVVAHPQQIGSECLKMMDSHQLDCVFVVDPHTHSPLGVIHRQDLSSQECQTSSPK
jgi:arabinose-5-phosphate isomerase